jgi:hypothetical protein
MGGRRAPEIEPVATIQRPQLYQQRPQKRDKFALKLLDIPANDGWIEQLHSQGPLFPFFDVDPSHRYIERE